jgi:RHS repeat-associated protein
MWGIALSGATQGAGGVGGLLSANDSANGLHFAAYDGNGNLAALVKGTDGAISAQYEYGPFGEPIRVTGPMGTTNPIRFSTKYTDDESDFLYYGKRYYNPGTGRWLNRDSIGELGGLSLYLFVYNNALTHWDSFGLEGDTYGELRDALLDDNATAEFYKVCKTIGKTGKTIVEMTPQNTAVELATGKTITGDEGSRIAAGAGLVVGWLKPVKKLGGACCGKVKKCVISLFKKGRKVPVISGVPLQAGRAYKGIVKDGKVVQIREISDRASHPDMAKVVDALIDPGDPRKGLKPGCSAFTILDVDGKWIPIGSGSFGGTLSLDEETRRLLDKLLE